MTGMTTVADIGANERPTIAIDLDRGDVVAANDAGRLLVGISAQAALPVPLDISMPAIQRLRDLADASTPIGTQVMLNFWANGRSVSRLCRVAFPNVGKPLAVIQDCANDDAHGKAPAPHAEAWAPHPNVNEDVGRTADSAADTSGDAVAPVAASTPPDLPEPPDSDRLQVWSNALQGDDEPSSTDKAAPADELGVTGTDAPDSDASDVEDIAAPPARSDSETLAEIARRIREGQSGVTSNAAPAHAAPARETPDFAAKPEADNGQAGPSLPGPLDLARLAHELKTPLTAIAAAAEVMRDERLGPMHNARYREYAAGIHASSEHALAVIKSMLGIGEDADGEQQSAFVALREVTDAAIAMAAADADVRNIEISVISDGGSPTVRSDATVLRQIVLNLLNNAIKFTPKFGIVRLYNGYLDDGTPFIAIRDEGAGLDPQIVVRARRSLIEPRGATPIERRRGGGFGLGLPLVLRLADDIGATIEFDSAPGRGTVALVTFKPR